MIRLSALILLVSCLGCAQYEKPVRLYAGMGTAHHPIHTSSAEAQKYFDQGLTLMFGFNRPDAVRSFRKAAELDPKAPMIYWGLAQAWGPYVNMDGDPTYDMKESCAAVDKGLAIEGANAVERQYLDAAKTRCPEFADPALYIEAARKLAAANPDDLDAQVIFAEALMVRKRWRWYTSDGKPAEGIAEAERILESVLRRDPNHAGANHLYIHAVESSSTPERGIPSAMRLMGTVPGAGHVVHMPGHIWMAVGEYETAADVNERAAEVDRRYFADTGYMSPYYPYYLHNISFIVYARGMQGSAAMARKAEQQMAGAAGPAEKMMPQMAGMFESLIVFSQLRTNRWNEVLAAPQPPAAADPAARAVSSYVRSVAFAMLHKTAEAARERDRFEEARKAADRNADWGVNRLGPVLDLASAVLEARAQPTPAAAVSFWRKAAELQDALVYDEPPAWYYPVRESLGATLMLSGDSAAAEAVFREALKRSPRNGRVLFGLRESLKAQGKNDAAAMVDVEFRRAWSKADITLRFADF